MSSNSVTIFKYHGTGNDFVIVDGDQFPVDVSALAPALCDRHRGVGADGAIVVHTDSPNVPDGFDAAMAIYNRDGTRPEMCGNGIRCVARFLVEQRGFASRLRVATDAGERVCVAYPGESWQVDVDMGEAGLGAQIEVEQGGQNWDLQPVDMGNPHAVTFAAATDRIADEVGASLNASASPFGAGVNVEFVTIPDDNVLDVVVYERGVGRTQACGTGACAAAVAAWSSGRAARDSVTVRLPGGDLVIRPDGEHVWMRGDVEFVMQAELGTGWLRARTQ